MGTTELKRKVYGKPLQSLYQTYLKNPKALPQPKVLRWLSDQLDAAGLRYHPRTLKRQLLGTIEYVPVVLEDTLLRLIQNLPATDQKQLHIQWKREKDLLAKSEDTSLFVTPEKFLGLADLYLLQNKNQSRRKLALLLADLLKEKKISLGLETLQAALAGKTQKVRKVLEEEIYQLVLRSSTYSSGQIHSALAQLSSEGHDEIQKVAIGEIGPLVDNYLLKNEGLSRRQLALELKNRLATKGYNYHLSSLQSVLEGKTKKTRKVILNTLTELLKENGLNPEEPANPSQLHRNHYVPANQITSWVEALLAKFAQLTRRQIAHRLQEDLQKKRFHFSLNTLQFILAGKTQRVKKIVLETLESYLNEKSFQPLTQRGASFSHKGRPSLVHRIEEAFQHFHDANNSNERERFRQELLSVRWEFIRRLWQAKHVKYQNLSSRGGHESADEPNPSDTNYGFEDPSVSYDVRESSDRLVS